MTRIINVPLVAGPGAPVPATSFLEELRTTYSTAARRFEEACTAFAASHKKRRGYDLAEPAKAFVATDIGKKLNDEANAALRRLDAAKYIGLHLDLGGVVFVMADLRPEARELAQRAFAEHGVDSAKWPSEAREKLARQLKDASRPQTNAEALKTRTHELKRDHRVAIEALLAKHGQDPSKWPVAELDKIAVLAGRIDAIERVASSCADAGWAQTWSQTWSSRAKGA